MNIQNIMFSLLRSELFGTDERIENLSREEMIALYKLSKKHDMAHIVSNALSKRLTLDGDISAAFSKQQMLAVYRYTQLDYEQNEICRVLEEAEIPHVPLKGAIMRQYYKEPWMRTSCDIDVLIHEEDLDKAVAAISDQLGYRAEENRHYHDVSLFSENGVHLELHFSIKENMENIDGLLSRVWEYCRVAYGFKYRFEQTKEYFLFHHIAHMSYHFSRGGCGIKPLADLYLLMEKGGYDEDVVIAYCDECGLTGFYESVKHLARVWFGNEAQTEISMNMEKFLLEGGVYGAVENLITLSSGENGGKIKYALSLVWAPYARLKKKYPVLEKHKWLTPFMQVRRWFSILLGGRIKKSFKRLKRTVKIDDDKAREIKNLFDEIGL